MTKKKISDRVLYARKSSEDLGKLAGAKITLEDACVSYIRRMMPKSSFYFVFFFISLFTFIRKETNYCPI